MQKVNAMIHSLESVDEATIIEKIGDNLYIAEYKGKRYTAIFNPFRWLYYLDDIYGAVPDEVSAKNL